ncbi:MAG TPA: hypothetical protein VD998_04380 [Verrucomicrobiae bacterium]|nr:hypothetical protein [Verrucomicrobiae bacterium]
MQEINLLQSKLKDRAQSWDRKNTAMSAIMGIITVAVLAAGGFLYFLNGNVVNQTDQLKTDNLSIQTKLDSSQGELVSAKNFQAQLKNIDTLLKGHVYWSGVFDELEATILKEAQYVVLSARSDLKMHAEGVVNSYTDLGKLILSLSTHENFSNVELLGVQRNSGQITGFRFALDFEVKPDLLRKQ